VRALLAGRGAIEAPLYGAEGRRDLAVIRATRRSAPLLINDAAAVTLLAVARSVRALGGAMAEAGVYQGGSARLLCQAKGEAPLHLFDVFETLQAPSPGADDAAGGVRAHFGRVHGRRQSVEGLLAGYPGVSFHAGVFPASAGAAAALRFSFVHLDLDLPGGTRDALDFFHPRLLQGGILIGDDHQDAAVRATFDAFLAARGDTAIALPWGQVMIVRQGQPYA
jgi:O-methyltransferase